MKKMPSIRETLKFIRQAHADQFDQGGKAYWRHPLAVMKRLPAKADLEVKLAALLHDVIEDTSFNRQELSHMGYTDRTLDIVDLVTKKEGDTHTYAQKVDGIIQTGNYDAIQVKFADMSENFDIERLSKLPIATQEKLTAKYCGPHKKLEEALKTRVPTIKETLLLIKKAHQGQVDKAGNPYWKHSLGVLKRLPVKADHEVKLAALLHDILEKTSTTAQDLSLMGYSKRTLDIVQLVTNNKNDKRSYGEKVDAIIETRNRDAIKIKFAEISENFDPKRIAKLTPALQEEFTKKYSTPYQKSGKVLESACALAEPPRPVDRSVDFIKKYEA